MYAALLVTPRALREPLLVARLLRTIGVMLPIFYATSEGQTARIANAIAQHLSAAGHPASAVDITTPEAKAWSMETVPLFILGASVHAGAHPRAAERFVKHHLGQLPGARCAFFSVSMSASNSESRAQADENLARFLTRCDWNPVLTQCIAGRLAYTKYGWIKRRFMRRIAESMNAPTDTAQDHEFTDWEQVRDFADRLIQLMGELGLGLSERAHG